MDVINRNGLHEAISFDKILNRITSLCNNLDKNYVDPIVITKDTINNIYSGISTRELDNLSADISASKIQIHPDFNILATRICVSNLQKETSEDYVEVIKALEKENVLSKSFVSFVYKNQKEIQSMFDYSKDYLFDFFGIKTLERSYLLRVNNKIVERPQHMWMRVAIQIHGLGSEEGEDENGGDDEKGGEGEGNKKVQQIMLNIKKTYNLLSEKYFTHATPTLFNSGMKRPQLSSCFLFNMEDNIENIFKVVGDMAQISKYSGGIGLTINKIRGRNSRIRGTNGKSDGVLPLCKVIESLGRYINQGSKRLGSIACYMEPWHVDIKEFIELRKNTGDENLRARDLFLALWVCDLFMKKVMNNEDWYLMCPDECPLLNETFGEEFEKAYESYVKDGKYKKKISSTELWHSILECQIETGMPYLLFKDHINKKSNQSNVGMIKSSNLCVSEDTLILTRHNEWDTISRYTDKYVDIWNGEKWSTSLVRKTSNGEELLFLTLSDGSMLRCTKEHLFILEDNSRVRAIDLTTDHYLKRTPKYPCMPGEQSYDKDNFYYASGFCQGRPGSMLKIQNKGIQNKGYLSYVFSLPKTEEHLVTKFPYLHVPMFTQHDIQLRLKNTGFEESFFTTFIPIKKNSQHKLEWLTGLFDSCGSLVNNTLSLFHFDKEFLHQIRFVCQTIGVNPSFFDIQEETKSVGFEKKTEEECKFPFSLKFTTKDTYFLYQIGIFTLNYTLDYLSHSSFLQHYKKLTVVSKTHVVNKEPTWCLHEPEKNQCVFNGILTANCAEITEYTDENETAVCNLASINLQRFVTDKTFDFEKLKDVVYTVTSNLDKVIDVNFYPTKETSFSNKKHRPIGLGVQGLADVYCRLDMSYSSQEAKDLNKKIFEIIYFTSLRSSCDRAKKLGKYSSFVDSPFSKGLLQWHLWGVERHQLSSDLDWDGLIQDVKLYGTRNSLLTALMPTASTSQILKNNESFEPFTSNLYLRKTSAGEYVVVNEHLVRHLISINLWSKEMYQKILYFNGSIQNIHEIPSNIRSVYMTAFEMKQSDIVKQCIDRGPFIDQTQSMNLFQQVPDFDKLTKSHFFSWKNGLKTGMYYLRTQPKVDAIKFGLEPSFIKKMENDTKKNEKENDNKMFCKKIQRVVDGNIESCVICSS